MKIFVHTLKDQFYADGTPINAPRETHDKIITEITKRFGKTVVDLGSGRGGLVKRLQRMGYDSRGYDLENGWDLDCDLDRGIIDDPGSVDFVTCIEVLEHLAHPIGTIYLAHDMLKTGGVAFFTTPNISGWFGRAQFLLTGNLQHFGNDEAGLCDGNGHISPLPANLLKILFLRAGFSQVEIYPLGDIPLIWFNQFSVNQWIWNFIGWLFYAFMRGYKKGWSLLIVATK